LQEAIVIVVDVNATMKKPLSGDEQGKSRFEVAMEAVRMLLE